MMEIIFGSIIGFGLLCGILGLIMKIFEGIGYIYKRIYYYTYYSYIRNKYFNLAKERYCNRCLWKLSCKSAYIKYSIGACILFHEMIKDEEFMKLRNKYYMG